MRAFISFLSLGIVFFSAGIGAAQETSAAPRMFLEDGRLDLDAVVHHFDNLYRADSSIAVAEFTVTRPNRTRSMTMKIWTRGRDKALILVQAPVREAGTATLKVGDNLWNYLPRIKRTIRIPPSMMLASWMGSDFTNDDLVRESSFTDDYTYRLLGPSEDPPGWLVAFDARPGVAGLWNRIEVIISKDGTIPVQARYFDRRDRPARSMHWDEVRVFDGRRLPARMVLIPEDEEGHRTEMKYREIRFDVEVPEGTFSLSNLERQR
ncbi:MAG: outer membrane lipoprotein-sorting protein [Thermodesulfobacteriota bacterium]